MTLPCLSMTPILAVLVSTLTLAAGLDVSHGQCNLDGLCLGNYLDETIAEDKVACINFCRTTPGCFWYSLDIRSLPGLCLALEDCPTLDNSMTKPGPLFTSGNKDCSKYTCNEPGKCHGKVIDADIDREDANRCLRHCQYNPDCLWFTYHPQDQACILLADCSEGDLEPCSDCLSGQRQCNSEEIMTGNKLMFGGKHFELIDLYDSNKPNCPLPDYPGYEPAFMTFDEEAGLVRGCGALLGDQGEGSNKCFTFDGFKWEENMESANYSYYGRHFNGGSAKVPDIGWWIFEYYHNENGIGSEVYSFTNEEWMPGPAFGINSSNYLPDGGFCIAQLNKSHSMLIGGERSFNSIADVVLYDWTKGEWTPGPPMQRPRNFHRCTSFGSGSIMVAGGWGGGYHNQSYPDLIKTEIYDPEIDAWYYSKDLPHSDYNYYDSNGTLTNWNGSPLWIARGTISKFVNGEWILLESTPSNDNGINFAITLPDDFIPDC
jgi:hypothetical protein